MQKSNRVRLAIVGSHLWNLELVRLWFRQDIFRKWRLDFVLCFLDYFLHYGLTSQLLVLHFLPVVLLRHSYFKNIFYLLELPSFHLFLLTDLFLHCVLLHLGRWLNYDDPMRISLNPSHVRSLLMGFSCFVSVVTCNIWEFDVSQPIFVPYTFFSLLFVLFPLLLQLFFQRLFP